MAAFQTTSVLTCPECAYAETLEMPTDACVFFHECASCGTVLRPKLGDCCVAHMARYRARPVRRDE
jgi:Zn ribbon nucleic-acid-binding protein